MTRDTWMGWSPNMPTSSNMRMERKIPVSKHSHSGQIPRATIALSITSTYTAEIRWVVR